MARSAGRASTGVRDVALHRGRFEGGRWLLLGELCVLDVQTLEAYRFEYPSGFWPNQFKNVIAMSPDQRSFVRYGSGESPENAPLLVVVDFVADTSYKLPIDRRLMRYNDWDEIDGAWLEHYFEWRREAGHDRLAQREDIAPLPYRGRLVDDSDAYREYRVPPVKREMLDEVIEFLEREFDGQRLLPDPYGTSISVAIGDQTVHVMFDEDHVGLWMDRDTDSRLVLEIAQRFDEELATGRYDDLFTP